ncbi:MAG: ABC-F family ATP-binding cassette domain-containing protein [Anaerovoracaceae bacterium]|jgi:ATP-binding cassette subfamily F protein 3
MIVMSANDISKAYGTDVILDRVSFHVESGDRVGIVGVNGAGKTTLLDIAAGGLESDSGNLFIPGDVTVGYLRQNDEFSGERTVRQEVTRIYSRFRVMEDDLHAMQTRISEMGARGETGTQTYQDLLARYGDLQERYSREGGFSYQSEQRGILSSMAFDESELDRPVSGFSGGERTRLALACLLMEKPDLLLLDEPTNHLDIGMLKWLEQFLRQYQGTVVMVSHDRYFLDQLCTKIFEIERGRLTVYKGNYTEYARKKKEQRQADLRAYNKQQTEIRRQEDMIRRFRQHGTEHLAKRAASREKRLAQIDRIERPEAELSSMKIRFHQDYETGTDVLYGEDLAKSFGTGEDRKDLFEHVSFDIKKGERICIVGQNGIGKTTLLRMILGETQPTAGYLRVGHNVKFGYYDQRQEQLDESKTVIEEVHDDYRLYKDSEIRGFLGRFLFSREQVFNEVGSLSGGEKARLALLKLMLSGANVLLLDEPTNHLDIASKEVFEEALIDYPGTVLAVSHDRYFLNRVATKIFELSRDGIRRFEGGYDYYEEKKASIDSTKQYVSGLSQQKPAKDAEARPPGDAETDREDEAPGMSAAEERRLKKQKEAEERRRERKIQSLEDEIEQLEETIDEIQKKMCEPSVLSDSAALTRLNGELQEHQTRLDEAYEEWGSLS